MVRATTKASKTPLAQAATIAGVSVILGLLFDQFLFKHEPGLAFPVYVTGIAAGLVLLARYLGYKLNSAANWLLVPFLGFAGLVAFRASDTLTLMNLAACLLLLLLTARVAFRRRLTGLRIGEFLAIPLLPLQFFAPAKRSLLQLLTTPKALKTKPLTGQVIRGIAITLPVLLVFVVLFASADLIVNKYLTSLISIHLDPQLVTRTILVLLASYAFLGGYSYIFSRTEPEIEPQAPTPKSFLGRVESTILFASVNVLFFAFILVQVAYLFGGQANISAQGFTYAEYARKGFFELLAVAVVAFGLLWWGERRAAKTERGHASWFKFLSLALVVQVIAIMASAFKRLYLYEQAYGFTTLRLYSHAFTVLLAVIFLILAYKIIRSASDQAFAFPVLLTLIGFLGVMNLLNPDAFIARQNLNRYQDTGKIDIDYLGQLSDDAVPVLLDESNSLKPDDAQALMRTLAHRHALRTDHSWQAWNYARNTATHELTNFK